jgi:hypothetical protein
MQQDWPLKTAWCYVDDQKRPTTKYALWKPILSLCAGKKRPAAVCVAVSVAAYLSLAHEFPEDETELQGALHSSIGALANVVDKKLLDRATDWGRQVAQAIISSREMDGSDAGPPAVVSSRFSLKHCNVYYSMSITSTMQ